MFPAALIVITAGALNLLADAVRDAGADELLPGGAPDPATGSPGATADTPDTTKEQADAALPVA
ncbi:peptide/nickel transport system permease protein [Streptomyces melanosporofaciens]|uniref:Peptide/nickel transport system permease protein n=1 Tax=Streptomyces melanosporofaciens TaxID=67327 RepID=A0A1H5BXS3_STRMJ|nr:peptide/nickel transport system permease protein [Streptomyces melanosporofaciens]